MRQVETTWNIRVPDYETLYRFSIDRPADFWATMWEFGGVRGHRGARVVEGLHLMPGARFFPDAQINFVENLLRRRDEWPAMVFAGEDGRRRTVTHRELFARVTSFAFALRAAGIRPGDRVAGYLPNVPEAIMAALGAAAIGAVWSSCSPDFGVQGVVDRFGQIEPRVLVSADGYVYAGRTHDSLGRLREITHAIPSIEPRMSPTWIRPDACSFGRSICVTSPVTTTLEPKPSRVRNICICSGLVF